MEAKIGKFFESVGSFFGGGDQIPWCDSDVILLFETQPHALVDVPPVGIEREVAEATNGGSDEHTKESIMRLSWALVHSRKPEDVNRGVAMLEASLTNSSSPLEQREKLYLLAVGYYRSNEYSKSRQLLEQCLA
ncbi:hypothetical protein TIFTF001_047171, partial [Ficus carica]